MKRFTALVLSALMLFTALPTIAFGGRFEDVADGKWYSEGISFCAANEYMAGTSETVFDRSSTLTRAMFVTILAKIDGADLSDYRDKCSFREIMKGQWYSAPIEWAYQNGLASGIGNDKNGNPVFGYRNPVTREQIAVFLYVYAQYFNKKNESEPEKQINLTPRADLSVFVDVGRVHSWAKDAMEWAVAGGLFSGIGEGYLDPRGNCTRAQAAVLFRVFVLNFLSNCEHEWSEATCTEMSVCAQCDLKKSTELGHDIPYHLCIYEQKCTRCDYVEIAKDHDVVPPTCTVAAHCSICKIVLAPARGHNPHKPTCTIASFCIDCNAYIAPALGHTTSYGICERCNNAVFPTAYDKMYYLISNKGYMLEKDIIGYYSQEGTWSKDKDGLFQDFTYIVQGQKTIYLKVIRKDKNTGRSVSMIVELPDSNGRYYNFTLTLFDDKQTYGTVSGTLDTETYLQGKFTLKNYSGAENMKSEAMNMTSHLLKLNIASLCQATLNLYDPAYYHSILGYGGFAFKNCY